MAEKMRIALEYLEMRSYVWRVCCHCGSNIAGVIPPKDVVEFASNMPGVVRATDTLSKCRQRSALDQEKTSRNMASIVWLFPPFRTHA